MAESHLTIALVLDHYGADTSRLPDYGWHAVKCPFHGDRMASASVNLEKGAYRCHACDVYGDPLNVIARHEGFVTAGRPDRERANEFAERALGVRDSGVRDRDVAPRAQAWADRLL